MGVIKLKKKKRTEKRALPAPDEVSRCSFGYDEKSRFLTEHVQSIACHEKKARKEEGKKRHKIKTGDVGAGNVHVQHDLDKQEHLQSILCHEKKACKEEGRRKHKRKAGDGGAGNVHVQLDSDKQEQVKPTICLEKKALKEGRNRKHKRKTQDFGGGTVHVQQESDKQEPVPVKEEFTKNAHKKSPKRKLKRKMGDESSWDVHEHYEDKKEHEKNKSKETERMKHKRKKGDDGAVNAQQKYEGVIKASRPMENGYIVDHGQPKLKNKASSSMTSDDHDWSWKEKQENLTKGRKSNRLGSNARVEEREEYFCLSGADKMAEISGFDEDCARGLQMEVKKGWNNNKHNLNASAEERKGGFSVSVVEKVDEIPGVDEDCTRGMKKWLLEYKQSRPGLKILQERIDKFIADREAREEQEKKERELHAAEGGWTVVVHHKGRKKTTDSESGTAVGSVNQVAVLDKMTKKKSKELQDFYRFQKREARMNELMTLQAKFEHDKKRIQQLRAARKFRPY